MGGQRITNEYRHLLSRFIERLEADGVDVAEDSGIGRTGRWRFTSSQDTATPTLSKAQELRSYLAAKLPGVEIPPPSVPIKSLEHFDWIQLGEWMMENAPGEFHATVDRVRRIVEGRKAALALGTTDENDPRATY